MQNNTGVQDDDTPSDPYCILELFSSVFEESILYFV